MKWIDITEQLPISSKEVLVRCKHSVKHYGIAKYESGSWWEYFADDSIKGWAAFEGEITHWMSIENLQEPSSDDLGQAAIDYDSCRPALYGEDNEGDYVEYIEVRKDAFIAGAQWQKEQMMKGAIDATVTSIREYREENEVDFTIMLDKGIVPYVSEEDVKLIIIKE